VGDGDPFCLQAVVLDDVGSLTVGVLGDFSLAVDDAVPRDGGCVGGELIEGVADLAGITWVAGPKGDLLVGGDAAGGNGSNHFIDLSGKLAALKGHGGSPELLCHVMS